LIFAQVASSSAISRSSNQNASFDQDVITSFDHFNMPRIVKKACCEDTADLPDSAAQQTRSGESALHNGARKRS
jgi:hypothetical protein